MDRGREGGREGGRGGGSDGERGRGREGQRQLCTVYSCSIEWRSKIRGALTHQFCAGTGTQTAMSSMGRGGDREGERE